MVIAEFAFSVISGLMVTAIDQQIATLDFFQQRKIKSRVNDATAEVVQPLLPFLAQEKITEHQQRLLLQTCVAELQPLAESPEILFQGSLNGQKIFDNLYQERSLPQAIVEEGLKEIYTLLCPRIATLLCKIPVAVKDWETEAWSENFRRFDQISEELQALFRKVDGLSTEPMAQADATLTLVRRALAQKIFMELDLTGLRSDQPRSGKFDQFFIHPRLQKPGPKPEATLGIDHAPDSFRQFSQPNHRAILIGAPGAGKSTWAEWLQRATLRDWAAPWLGIGIRVKLRSFTGQDFEVLPPWQALIRNEVGPHLAEEANSERLSQWRDRAQIIFILDGFDEIPPSQRDRLRTWIRDLQTAVAPCPVVVTSRPLTTDHLEHFGPGWQSWHMEPFDPPRIVDYIQRWYAHTNLLLERDRQIDAEALAQDWQQDPTIGPLTGNPLLLSTLLMVHHLDGRLPSGRSQLYRRYVEGMLGIWDDRRQVSATTLRLSLEQKRQILRGLALHLHLQEQEQLDEPEITVLMQELLQRLNLSCSAEAVLALLRERSGLIIGPGIYSFIHKSVAEYLVAEAIVQGDQRDASGNRIDRFMLFEHRDDDRWNTVTFLWAGLAPVADVEAFMDECNRVKNWALGYGILLDQYDLIPVEIRRRLILELIHTEEISDCLHDPTYYFLYSGPYNLYRNLYSIEDESQLYLLIIPDLTLRSLTSKELSELILSAVVNRDLTWKNFANLMQFNNTWDLVWSVVAMNPYDLEDWKACISSYQLKSIQRDGWIVLAIHDAFYRAIVWGEAQDTKKIKEVLSDVFPRLNGLIILAMMLQICTVVVNNTSQSDQANRIVLNTNLSHGLIYLGMAIQENGDEISSSLLQETFVWYGISDKDRKFDLLLYCFQCLTDAKNKKVLEQDENLEDVINFTQGLIERREREKEVDLVEWNGVDSAGLN